MKALKWSTCFALIGLALAIDLAIVHLALPNGLRGLVSACIAFAGALYAATAFAASDAPRRGWNWLCAANVAMIITVLAAFSETAVARGIDHWLLVVSNVLWAASMLGFLSVTRHSLLRAPWTMPARAWMASCVVFAVGTLVFSLYEDLTGPAPVGSFAWSLLAAKIASVTADAIVFIGAVQLARSAHELRGGALAQSYVLLWLGAGTFLVLDFAVNFVAVSSMTQLTTLGEIVAVAWGMLGVAGLSQGLVIRRSMRWLAAPVIDRGNTPGHS